MGEEIISMKSRIILISVFLLTLSLCFSSAFAVSIEISGGTTKTMDFGKSTNFDFTVKNNLNIMMDYVALINGDNLGWVTLDKYFFFIPPLSQKKIGLVVYPQDNGTHYYSLTIQSVSRPEVHNTVDIEIRAIGPKKSKIGEEEKVTSIENVDASASRNAISSSTVVTNPEDSDITVDIYLKDSGGRILSTYSETAKGKGTHTIVHDFPTEDLLAGRYTVESVIREFVISSSTDVIIRELRDVRESREITPGFLYETVIIYVENLGNVVEEEYILTEITPATEYVTWETEPASQDIVDGNVESMWVLNNLRPKDKMIISYTINYWFSVLKIIIGIIVILVAISIVYIKLSKPTITKRFIKKGSDRYLVILEVKGSFFAPLKSVLIKDIISPLVHIEGKFEGIAPVIRKEKEKTELLWRIGTMKRMDERILSYNVKGKVEAQIKLQPAMLRYKKTEEGEKRRVFSNVVHLE